MAKFQYPKYATELAVQAACAAQRINCGYISVGFSFGPENRGSNKSLVIDLLKTPDVITDADREQAELVMTHFQSLLWKNTLSDRLMSDFDTTCMNIANSEEVAQNYLGQVAYMPSAYLRETEKRKIKDRLYECQQQYLDSVGKKVTTTIEIMTSVYSQKWGCYYYSAITKDNFNVRFSSGKSDFEPGQTYTVTAKVKEHCENHQTKLNYVKII